MASEKVRKKIEPEATRRVPSQERSRKRYEQILDAAARVFGDVGYEAATTEAIAREADTSIGSLYQFFPNKEALFEAIAARHIDKSRAVFDHLMVPGALDLPWDKLLDAGIDAFASMERDDPDFRAVWLNWHLSGDFLTAGDALNREFARRAEAVLVRRGKSISPARRALIAAVVIEVVSAMLFYAARRKDSAAWDAIVSETKVLLHRYLEPYAAPRPKGRGSKKKPG